MLGGKTHRGGRESMKETNTSNWKTMEAAAAELGVSLRTLRRHLRKREIVPARRFGRAVLSLEQIELLETPIQPDEVNDGTQG